jgi:hypothetical protein
MWTVVLRLAEPFYRRDDGKDWVSAPAHEHKWDRLDPRLRIDKALEIASLPCRLAPGWPISSASGGNLMGPNLMSKAFVKEYPVSSDPDDNDVHDAGRRAADDRHRDRRRFAMVGGLIVSQLITLFTTPVVYIYLEA